LKQSLSLPNNYKIEYDLKDSSAGVTDKSIDWLISYKMINASNPDVIKTKNGQILSSGFENYTKELNTKTNAATYTSQGSLSKGSFDPNEIMTMPTMNTKAIIYPNGTGIIESKER
jgi:hypothetical protein